MTDSAQMEIFAQHNQQVTSHLSPFQKFFLKSLEVSVF
jgi:hypothetical protein